ncbi:unnamed protein product, partial [Allacma fusca]
NGITKSRKNRFPIQGMLPQNKNMTFYPWEKSYYPCNVQIIMSSQIVLKSFPVSLLKCHAHSVLLI